MFDPGIEFQDPLPLKLAHASRDVQFHAARAAQLPAASLQHLGLSVESLADLAPSWGVPTKADRL